MDLNINELPEGKPRVEPRAMQPPPRDSSMPIKVAGFLAIVVVLTTLAITTHQGSTPATMASDTPPKVEGATTLPSVNAPSDRATTGSASTAPTIAPNPPSEAAAGNNSNQ